MLRVVLTLVLLLFALVGGSVTIFDFKAHGIDGENIIGGVATVLLIVGAIMAAFGKS